MKRHVIIGMLLGVIFLFASCGADINEVIVLDENFGGTYSIQTDITPFMRNMAYMTAKLTLSDSVKTIDSNAVEKKIFEKVPEVVDSVLNSEKWFSTKNMSPKQNELYKKNLLIKMTGGKKSQSLIWTLSYHFDSIRLLNDFWQQGSKEKARLEKMPSIQTSNGIFYGLKSNVFTRTTVQNKKHDSKDSTNEKMANLFGKMSEDAVYRTRILSKRKIISADGYGLVSQTPFEVVFEYSFDEFMNNRITQDFRIEFE